MPIFPHYKSMATTSCHSNQISYQIGTKIIPQFLEKLSLYRKKGHVLGCGAGVFGESGSVNQCGTKGKVYVCKLNLNHRQKPALLS